MTQIKQTHEKRGKNVTDVSRLAKQALEDN